MDTLSWLHVGLSSFGTFSIKQVFENIYLILPFTLIALCWIKLRQPNDAVKKLNAIPGPGAFWFCWTMLKFAIKGTLNVDLQQLLTGLSHVYDKTDMFRLWLANIPIVVLYRSETIELLLNNDEYLERPREYGYANPLVGHGLITSSVPEWRKRRKLLNPAFHYRILENCFPTFNKQCKILIHKLKQNVSDEPVDIVPYVQRCALDVICEAAMGVDIGSQHGHNVEYVKALHAVTEILPERVMQPWLHPDFVFYNLPIGRRFKKSLSVAKDFTRKIIMDRKEKMLQNPEIKLEVIRTNDDAEHVLGAKTKLAFLDLLLYHHLYDKELTEDDVQGEVDTFMFAGHDTASISVPWALFMIGNDSKVQERVHKELDEIFGGDKERPITYNDLRDMTYLKCVAKETLRMYPPGGIIGRLITKDLSIKNTTIPRGTRCLLFLYQLHRDPRYFPNPEAFQPERFYSSNFTEGHPYAYIPFSAGSRNCIGQKFAQNEQLTLLADILRNFSVKSADKRDKIKLSMEVVLRPASPLRMYLSAR